MELSVATAHQWPNVFFSIEQEEHFHLNLLLAGPPGTDKTHLAAAIYFEALAGGFFTGVEFIRAETLAHQYEENDRKKSELFRRYGDGADHKKNNVDVYSPNHESDKG